MTDRATACLSLCGRVMCVAQANNIMPLLICTVIAYSVAGCFTVSLYDMMLEINNLPYLPRVKSSSIYRLRARDAMHTDFPFLSTETTGGEALALLATKRAEEEDSRCVKSSLMSCVMSFVMSCPVGYGVLMFEVDLLMEARVLVVVALGHCGPPYLADLVLCRCPRDLLLVRVVLLNQLHPPVPAGGLGSEHGAAGRGVSRRPRGVCAEGQAPASPGEAHQGHA